METGVYLINLNDLDAFLEAVKLTDLKIHNSHKKMENDETFVAFSIAKNNKQNIPRSETYPVSKMKKWSQKKILV